MIIGGTKLIEGNISSGRFFCEKCGREESYQITNVKEYAHLFWVPLFPTQDLGNKMNCFSCNAYYPLSILNDPGKIRAGYGSGLVLGNIPADTGKRIGAFFLDLAFIYVLALAIVAGGGSFLISLLPFAYFLFCDFYFKGSSIGKKIIAIELTDRDEGDTISPARIIVRNLVKCLSLLFPVLYIAVFFNENKMSLHDKAANTMVVEKNRIQQNINL